MYATFKSFERFVAFNVQIILFDSQDFHSYQNSFE